MAYNPTLQDLDSATSEYKPSLADISEPQEKEQKKSAKKPYDFLPKPMSKEKEKQYRQKKQTELVQGLQGFGQGIANIPSETVNLARPNTLPLLKKAPNTESARVGEMVAPFFGPQALESGALKALSLYPKAMKSLNALTAASKEKPIVNALTKAGRAGAETGYINALEHPENEQREFTKGAAFGVPLSLLSRLGLSGIPYLGTLAKAAAGGLIGSQFGHPLGGALVGAGLPVRSLFGLEPKTKIAEEMLSGLTPKDISKSTAAARRLGTNITPAEASGNYPLSAGEGRLKSTSEGGQLGYRLEAKEKANQQKAINNMLNKIYKETPEKEERINKLYALSERYHIKPEILNKIKSNPIINDAFATVKSDPVFSEVPETNYKFLAEVNRQLNRDYTASLRNKPNSANAIKNTKSTFNDFLKSNNPVFKAATEAAQPKIVRRNVEGKLNKEEEDFSAKTFYSKLLNSRKSYRDLLRDLKNFPEAQADVKDMRAAWKNLSNMKTTSQSEAQSKVNIDQIRNFGNFVKTTLKNIAGARGDKRRLQYIYSPNWEKDFEKVAMNKDANKRITNMIDFIVKSGTQVGLSTNQTDNIIKLLKDKQEE